MSQSIWNKVWADDLEKYTNSIHHDARFKYDKKTLVFWYCFSIFDNWEDCFSYCAEDRLTEDVSKKIKTANDRHKIDMDTWVKTMTTLLTHCSGNISPRGKLSEFVSNVFGKETKSVCEPAFIYLMYLCLYSPNAKEYSTKAASMKKLRRDTYDLISNFRKTNEYMDVHSLCDVCKAVYSLPIYK